MNFNRKRDWVEIVVAVFGAILVALLLAVIITSIASATSLGWFTPAAWTLFGQVAVSTFCIGLVFILVKLDLPLLFVGMLPIIIAAHLNED